MALPVSPKQGTASESKGGDFDATVMVESGRLLRDKEEPDHAKERQLEDC